RLPAGGARDGGDGGAARSAQQCQHPRLLRIRSPLGLTAAGRLRSDLGCRPRLDGARRFALGHAKLLLSTASAQQRAGGLAQQRAGGLAQQRAATTQTPRRPIGAGGVRGASRSGLASVITTHALFARKVQRKLSDGVAALQPADHLWTNVCAAGYITNMFDSEFSAHTSQAQPPVTLMWRDSAGR